MSFIDLTQLKNSARAGFARVASMPRQLKRWVLLSLDAGLAPFALLVSIGVLFNDLTPLNLALNVWPLFPFLAVMAAICSSALGIPKIKLKSYESQAILTTGVGAVLVSAALYVFGGLSGYVVPPGAIVLFGLVYFLGSVGARAAMLRILLWVVRSAQPRCRVAIYGAGTTGMQLAAALKSHDNIVPIAFVDDSSALQSLSIAGLRVYSADRIAVMAKKRQIDRVLLAMPSISTPKLLQISRRLEKLGLDVFSIPSFAQLAGTEAMVAALAPILPGKLLGREQVDAMLPEGSDAYQGKSILVTGAGGSIGSEICRQLIGHAPKRIVLMEISEAALYGIDRELRDVVQDRDIEIVPVLGSVTDSRISRAVMAGNGVEVVLHAAAYKHVPLVEANPLAGMMNNVIGTRVLADAAEEVGVERFILISTDKAVRPTNMMGASKRLAEMVVQDLAKRSRKTVFSMVRFGNVLGSSGSVVPLFNEQISRGGPVTVTDPEVTRFFMTISEAVRLVLLAGSFTYPGASRGGDVFVLDMGEPMKIIDLARQMIEASGYSVRDSADPQGDIKIKIIGLRPGEKLHEELLIGEGLLTTPHPKILRAQEGSLSELDMAIVLQDLGRAVTRSDAEAARQLARTYVEGFQSQEPAAASVAVTG
jgi:FlaA1/EpsC-like NDP-sugar epimerase